MVTLQIDVYAHRVLIEGQEIKRPTLISPSNWMDYWDEVKNSNNRHCDCSENDSDYGD